MTTPRSVNEAVERIGEEIVRHAGGKFMQSVLYAEVEDGVAEASVIVQGIDSSAIECVPVSWELSELLMDLWDLWGQEGEGAKWQAFTYRVSADGVFAITPIYQPELRDESSFIRRRAEVITRMFGSVAAL